jgi:hypothetical protein
MSIVMYFQLRGSTFIAMPIFTGTGISEAYGVGASEKWISQ